LGENALKRWKRKTHQLISEAEQTPGHKVFFKLRIYYFYYYYTM
jgi:hypothetical protein